MPPHEVADAVVDALYGGDPAEFTTRRDALAAEARQAGSRAEAAAIKALRRPSTAAWVVNTLARDRPAEVRQLVELGERFREAQAALSGDDLRALGRQRQQVILGLARAGRALARDLGHPVSDAVEREVEATLEAALADRRAGEAVSAGVLVRALENSGLGDVDLSGAVATALGPSSRNVVAKKASAGQATTENDSALRVAAEQEAAARQAADAARARAEERVRIAAEELATAESAQQAATVALAETEQRIAQAEESVRRLEDELGSARRQAIEAERGEREAARTLERARRVTDEAAHRLAAAATGLDELHPR